MRRKEKRVAAQGLVEADKIKIVTAAEAEAEKRPLRIGGVGIAPVPTEGYCRWIGRLYERVKGTNVDLTEEQIMSILLTNQYLDTLNNLPDKGRE